MKKVVAVSGGFDPVHVGHVRMFKAARALGDELVVILNNDNWINKKKGKAFMPEQERKEVLESIQYIDKVVLTDHPENPDDMSVCAALEKLRPDVLANGGDRVQDNTPEVESCKKLGTRLVFNIGGGKIQSSSWLLNDKKG